MPSSIPSWPRARPSASAPGGTGETARERISARPGARHRHGARCHRQPGAQAWIDGFAAEGGIDHFVANERPRHRQHVGRLAQGIDIDIVATVIRSASASAPPEDRGTGATSRSSARCRSSRLRRADTALSFGKGGAGAKHQVDGDRDGAQGRAGDMVSPGTILEDGNTWGRQRDAATSATSAASPAIRWAAWAHPGSRGLRRVPRRRAGLVISGANMVVDGASPPGA